MAIPIKLSQEGYIHTWIFSAALHIIGGKKAGEREEDKQGYSQEVI